jgi:hypothetical protein
MMVEELLLIVSEGRGECHENDDDHSGMMMMLMMIVMMMMSR